MANDRLVTLVISVSIAWIIMVLVGLPMLGFTLLRYRRTRRFWSVLGLRFVVSFGFGLVIIGGFRLANYTVSLNNAASFRRLGYTVSETHSFAEDAFQASPPPGVAGTAPANLRLSLSVDAATPILLMSTLAGAGLLAYPYCRRQRRLAEQRGFDVLSPVDRAAVQPPA